MTRTATRTCATVFVYLLLPVSLAAQEPRRVYLFGGAEAVIRQSGSEGATGPDRSLVPGGLLGLGVWVRPTLAIEGSLSLQRGQTIPWRFTYLFALNTLERTTDRDMPIVGSLRYAARAGQRVGADFLVGAGVTRHYSRSVMTADCGPGSNPHPCVPLVEPAISDTWNTWERLFSVGFEVPVLVGRGATVGPAAHVVYIRRGSYLTGYNHRGPIPGSGFLASFGFMASWRDR